MKRLLFIILFVSGNATLVLSGWKDVLPQIGSNKERSISWWVSAADPHGISSLRHVLTRVKLSDGNSSMYPLMRTLKKIYLCCNIFNISQTDGAKPRTFVDKKFTDKYLRKTIDSYRMAFPGVKILAHVQATFNPMIKNNAATTNSTNTAASLAQKANDVGFDGVTVDYEPQQFLYKFHAEVYVDFLNKLATELHKRRMKIGTVIAAWGILKHYDLYGRSKVDFLGSMSSTYYGKDVDANRRNVKLMLKEIPLSRLEIGLGLMHTEGVVEKPKRLYEWERAKLKQFVRWLAKQGIGQIHVWPGAWRSHKKTKMFYLKVLAKLSSGYK